MDALLSGILDETIRRADLEAGHSVLDIGCGAGSSTLAIAEQIGERSMLQAWIYPARF